MSFLLSWLGLRAQKAQQSVRRHEPPSLPDTPYSDTFSVIDKNEAIEDENSMAAFNAASNIIIQQILTTHARLLKLPDFNPSPKVESLLGALVALCCKLHDSRVVSQV